MKVREENHRFTLVWWIWWLWCFNYPRSTSSWAIFPGAQPTEQPWRVPRVADGGMTFSWGLASYFGWPRTMVGIALFIAGLFFKMWLDVLSWTLHSFDHGIHFWCSGLIGQFTPVLALYDPFGVDVPLNFDITHSLHFIFFISVWTQL